MDIDIILGMYWLRKYDGVILCAKRAIRLTKEDGKPLGCSVKLRWRNCGMVWVKLRWLEPTRHKRGHLGGCDAHAGGETSMSTLQAR
jgi:hypothetical protein